MAYYKYIMKIIDFNTKNEKQKVAPIDFSDIVAKNMYAISDVEEKHYLNVLKTCVDAINYPMIEEINKLVKL